MSVWDNIDWWEEPSLAYGAGLTHGFERGWAMAQAKFETEYASMLTHIFGPPGDRGARLVGAYEQIEARKRADEPGPRDGDHPGARKHRSGAT